MGVFLSLTQPDIEKDSGLIGHKMIVLQAYQPCNLKTATTYKAVAVF